MRGGERGEERRGEERKREDTRGGEEKKGVKRRGEGHDPRSIIDSSVVTPVF